MKLIAFIIIFSTFSLGFFLGAGLVHSVYKRRAAMVRDDSGFEA